MLEDFQICVSCQESVSTVQDILILLYIFDRGKMKDDINNSTDFSVYKKNDNVEENIVDIKQEIEETHPAVMTCPIEEVNIKIEQDDENKDNITYEDFTCKNEEVDFKMECDGEQSSYG